MHFSFKDPLINEDENIKSREKGKKAKVWEQEKIKEIVMSAVVNVIAQVALDFFFIFALPRKIKSTKQGVS